MKNLQGCVLCCTIRKAPRLVVSPVAGGHVNLYTDGVFIQLNLIGDLLPRTSEQCSFQIKGKECTYEINIKVLMGLTQGHIGEHYGMLSVL